MHLTFCVVRVRLARLRDLSKPTVMFITNLLVGHFTKYMVGHFKFVIWICLWFGHRQAIVRAWVQTYKYLLSNQIGIYVNGQFQSGSFVPEIMCMNGLSLCAVCPWFGCKVVGPQVWKAPKGKGLARINLGSLNPQLKSSLCLKIEHFLTLVK